MPYVPHIQTTSSSRALPLWYKKDPHGICISYYSLNVAFAKTQKTELTCIQIYSVTGVSGGNVSVQALSGSGAVFFVDHRVKTVKVTNNGSGSIQYGNATFAGVLPTIISQGLERGTFGNLVAGASTTFDWSGSAGLFFVGSMGAAGSISLEVSEYIYNLKPIFDFTTVHAKAGFIVPFPKQGTAWSTD